MDETVASTAPMWIQQTYALAIERRDHGKDFEPARSRYVCQVVGYGEDGTRLSYNYGGTETRPEALRSHMNDLAVRISAYHPCQVHRAVVTVEATPAEVASHRGSAARARVAPSRRIDQINGHFKAFSR